MVLKFIFKVYRQYDKAIDPSAIHNELSARLREELDYRREVKQIQLYQEMLKNTKNVHVPELVRELCGERLISMQWLEGLPLLDFIRLNSKTEIRNK